MHVSLNITNFSWPSGPAHLAAELGRIARQADDGGLDTVWVSDHLIQAEPGTEPTQEMLEAYTTLGYLAASRTIRVIRTPAAGPAELHQADSPRRPRGQPVPAQLGDAHGTIIKPVKW